MIRAFMFACAIIFAGFFIGRGLRDFGTGPLEFQWKVFQIQKAAAINDMLNKRGGSEE